MSAARRCGRLAVVVGAFLATAVMVPSDSRAVTGGGGIIVWFDDLTNTANGSDSLCISLSNDSNGDANGNKSGKTTTNKTGTVDKNGTGNGNAGAGSGGGICLSL